MNRGITTKQLKYAAALFIVGANLLMKNTFQFTKNETWIAVVIATAAGLVIVSIYGTLAGNHPGCTLFEINERVFGVVGGKIQSALYLFYFLSLAVFNTQDLGSFVNNIILKETPLNLILAIFLIICVYAARRGADKMTQYGAFIIFVYFILISFNTVLLIPKMRLTNFLPVLTIPVKKHLLSALFVTMLPFSEVLVFLMLAPNFEKPATTGKALRWGLLFGAANMLLLVFRDIAVLGEYALYTSDPMFATIRLIDVGDILTRLETIFAVFQITVLFFKISILVYALTVGIGQLFNIREDGIFTTVAGALILVCAGFFFKSQGEKTLWFRAAATYGGFFLLILPVLTLSVSKIRKSADTKGTADMQKGQ